MVLSMAWYNKFMQQFLPPLFPSSAFDGVNEEAMFARMPPSFPGMPMSVRAL